MWKLSDPEKHTLREFLRWLFSNSLDYDLVRYVPHGVPHGEVAVDEDVVLDEDAVLAAYVRWREVLGEQG
jgi:hypothetical protein